jgi:hypothetical protein
LAWWLVALRWLVGLWLLAMDPRWLDLLDLRLKTELKVSPTTQVHLVLLARLKLECANCSDAMTYQKCIAPTLPKTRSCLTNPPDAA